MRDPEEPLFDQDEQDPPTLEELAFILSLYVFITLTTALAAVLAVGHMVSEWLASIR